MNDIVHNAGAGSGAHLGDRPCAYQTPEEEESEGGSSPEEMEEESEGGSSPPPPPPDEMGLELSDDSEGEGGAPKRTKIGKNPKAERAQLVAA